MVGQFNRREVIATGVTALWASQLRAQTAELTELGIADASQLIRAGRLSPVELVDAYTARIERVNPQINAYITVTDEQARERARVLEAELAQGNWRGPLHGIPIALKDNIDTAGVRTTAASAVYENRVPTADAEVVRRLDEAGAIILGKLNMHEFAYGASSAISHFGPVRNPWDPQRIPGGSSGGSGAAVAARLCCGALGTDTGGSIRIPAAHCGIVGLKPTYGLASIRGIVPLSVSMDHVGPMCRSVEDTAILLQALVGFDAGDIGSIDVPIPDYTTAIGRDVSSLRIAVARSFFFEDVDAEILDAVENALPALAALTASTREIELPTIAEPGLTFVEAYAFHESLIDEHRERYDPVTLERVLRGADISAARYVALNHELQLGRKAIASVLEDVDIVVTPTLARLPIRIAATKDQAPGSGLIRNTIPFNFFGTPAITVPCGYSSEGLPIGLHLSGPALGELDVLALAHSYEHRTDWSERMPRLG